MSLRALKIVVNGSLRSAHDPDSEDCFHCQAVKAQAELAALEKAAAFYASSPAVFRAAAFTQADGEAAHALVATIAKESK